MPLSQEFMVEPPPGRGIFCNRTLNLRAIKAIGYDMDYTLIHYHVVTWERRAYQYLREKLLARGWPVADLRFDPDRVILGLILDIELGNVVKANRFGYIKQAQHGTRALSYEEQRDLYAQTVVDLADSRWVFVNTFFSVSEICMYTQLVDLLDQGKLSEEALGYRDLYREVRKSLDEAHMEGMLKGEIIADPEKYVDLDPDLPIALLDQKRAGKKLLLITNSEWSFTAPMMSYVCDRFLPDGMTWRDLFDVIIVSARKPAFFNQRNPIYEVVEGSDNGGFLKPVIGGIQDGRVYHGGNARLVEQYLGVAGHKVLYVGDHIYGDVRASKDLLRWRTALVLREIEDDLDAIGAFRTEQQKLGKLMQAKQAVEFRYCQVRLELQRKKGNYGPESHSSEADLQKLAQRYRQQIEELDREITPLAIKAAELSNTNWGLVMRSGNDKSQLARQVERYADIYLSRVSNFLYQSPFVYLRAPRGSLPHDDIPGLETAE